MENNRRQSERINVSLEVMMESSSGKYEVRVSDLSMEGCFVDSIAIMSNHDNVALRVRMPSGDWMKLRGEVVSVFPGIGFGVRFLPLDEEERNLLEEVILSGGGHLSPP